MTVAVNQEIRDKSVRETGPFMVDAIVVGAGAGGGIVAKELATAGWSVVVFERGPWLQSASFGHNEIRDGWVTGQHRVPFGPYGWEVRTARAGNDEAGRVVRPRDSRYGTLPACVGGGTVYYGAMAWRFHPETFRLRSYFGSIPGASLEDWPISYDDLEP
jgi:choline dehydrogenase-like flavoprotein